MHTYKQSSKTTGSPRHHIPSRSLRRGAASAVVALLTIAGCSSSGSSDNTTAPADTTAAAETTVALESTAADASATETTVAADTTVAVAGAATETTAAPSDTLKDASPAIVEATNAFLATLTDDEKSSVQFEFTNTEQRQKWSNLPEGLFTRTGLKWGTMTEASQNAWLAVMKATLSKEGYDRVMAEWAADGALAAEGGGGGLQFGKDNYWVAVIGTPSATEPWQWQWGGHHVTVNATVVGTEVALTPSFIGVQPATYTNADGTEVRPLGDIETHAYDLLNSLDETQKSKAVLGDTLIDLVLGPGADGKTITPEGLKGSEMTDAQQMAMTTLIANYGWLVNDEDALHRMVELKANIADTYFAWYGPTTTGSGFYFRISGPTIVIEYSGQSMGGDSSNHIHGIYRDPTNDYGAKLGAGLS